jgi:light-regulated signal transduction histidine kinase (bacteriophytochrome)
VGHLNNVAARAIKNLDAAIRGSGAAVTVDTLPAVLGNESHLVELFQNLIGNAIKYRSESPLEIRVSAEQLGSEWVVKIKDNGIGIGPQYRDHVFGLFKRLHGAEISGTGIGLAICKKIVERMGGKIWVESEPDQGSTFSFTIAAVSGLEAMELSSCSASG